MKRRLDLGLSLVHSPEILFLDEPTTGLDPGSRRVLWEEIKRLRDSGVTIILTTQYLEEADELADRIAIIDEGLVVAEGTADELKASIGGDVITFAFENNDNLETIAKRYFIPPNTIQFMRWGQAFMIFILFGLMFLEMKFENIVDRKTHV